MVATFAVIHSASYYTSQSTAEAVSYYTRDGGAGVWLRGHDQLGLNEGEAVQPEDFDRACAGVDAEGNSIVTAAPGRMLGVDITLSPPKDVSVLFALGGHDVRRTIVEAMHASVEPVLQLIEREVPLARRGHAGERAEHAKFAAAAFLHSESRPELHEDGVLFPDPQLHVHLCLPNVAQRADGSWGGINSVAIRSWRKTFSAVFALHLSSDLIAQGFAIKRDDDDWKWKVAGVPDQISRHFSARRNALEDALADAGLTSGAAPALAAAINRTDRRAKMALGGEELTARWRKAAQDLGFEPDAVIAGALSASAELQASDDDASRVRADRVAAVPERLTESSATFARRELIAATAEAMLGTPGTLDDALAATDGYIAEQQVITLADTRDGPTYSTPRMLAIERELVDLVRRGASTHVAHPDRASVETLIASTNLNAEQGAVVRDATSGKRLVLIQGSAGTGKSTALGAVAAAWQTAGYTVLGASVAWRAANALGEDLDIESRAIDAWLTSIDHGNTPFSAKTCLLIEESGLQSSPQAVRLLKAIDRAGGVAVMVGDEDQLRPVGAGHAMRLIREAVGATGIRTVVRQREAWAREAPRAFARGRARLALDTFAEHGLVHLHEGPRATIEALADRRQQLADNAPNESVLVVARTNAEARAVSAAIRNRLRERGAIVGDDVIVEAADASGNRHPLRLAVGDEVRFLRRNDELGVVNGTEARIVAIGNWPDGTHRFVAEEGGRRFGFGLDDIADAKGRARLAHSYSATIFQSQGITVDRALVLLGVSFDRRDAYVASSRAREVTEFYVDTKAIDRELDTTEQPESDEEKTEARMALLAQRLARASVKSNALDYERDDPLPTRRKELQHEL